MFDQLELGTSVQGFTLELDGKRFSVHDLEEDVEMVLANLLRVVQDVEIHLLTRSQRATSWLDFKDLAIKNLLFKCLLLAWGARISPSLHLDL